MHAPKTPGDKLKRTVLTIEDADFSQLQQDAQQDKAELAAMFDAVDRYYKEQEK